MASARVNPPPAESPAMTVVFGSSPSSSKRVYTAAISSRATG
ncbi:Uncharacterised protein [Mycobacterium tuberculosis]|uniref:Uncharacterized protein n=1 Tax=Mycobacterium tuberculosis TaxID=1773 RepID=A0A916PGU0_MYCTX|nr:Uncharacterised protein [Mycobacterium tuberculosis]